MGWTLQGSNLNGGEIFRTIQTSLGATQGMVLTTHSHIVPRLKKK
jgi:hypothetical protein